MDLLNDIPNHTILLLDEIHTFIESRASGTDLNTLTNDLFLQSRKTFVDVFGTDVLYSLADKRYRLTCDLLIEAQYRMNEYSDDFVYYYNYIENGKIVYTDRFIITYNDAEKFLFNQYNTLQLQRSKRFSKREFNIVRQEPIALLEKVKEISKIIKPNLINITHDSVKAGLLLNGFHIGYEKYVYLYLKNELEGYNVNKNKLKSKSST